MSMVINTLYHGSHVYHDNVLHVQDGRTALYMASFNGHEATVEYLLQQQADVNICRKVQCTTLHLLTLH